MGLCPRNDYYVLDTKYVNLPSLQGSEQATLLTRLSTGRVKPCLYAIGRADKDIQTLYSLHLVDPATTP